MSKKIDNLSMQIRNYWLTHREKLFDLECPPNEHAYNVDRINNEFMEAGRRACDAIEHIDRLIKRLCANTHQTF